MSARIAADSVPGARPVAKASTYRSIQCLRALAAAMVVVHHVFSHGATGQNLLAPWLQSGVDIFFVISGFVMVASTEGKALSAGQFLGARLVRIVPLYWAALAIFLALLVLAHDRPPALGEVVKSFFFLFYTDSRTGEPAPYLTPGWSLDYEMYFYLLFALLIRVPVVRRIAILAVFFVAAVGLRRFFAHDDALGFRLTSPLPLEFVAGMVLGHRRDLVRRGAPAAGLALMAAGAALLILSGRAEPRILFYGVPAVLTVAGAMMAEPLFAARPFQPVKTLGDASYSLYLSHSILIRSLMLLGIGPLMGQPLVATAIVLFCVGMSIPVYRFVETPLTRLAKGLLPPREARVPVSPGMPPS